MSQFTSFSSPLVEEGGKALYHYIRHYVLGHNNRYMINSTMHVQT